MSYRRPWRRSLNHPYRRQYPYIYTRIERNESVYPITRSLKCGELPTMPLRRQSIIRRLPRTLRRHFLLTWWHNGCDASHRCPARSRVHEIAIGANTAAAIVPENYGFLGSLNLTACSRRQGWLNCTPPTSHNDEDDWHEPGHLPQHTVRRTISALR